jgi:predicted  nucleic acid-binding Zn-ribbon protein
LRDRADGYALANVRYRGELVRKNAAIAAKDAEIERLERRDSNLRYDLKRAREEARRANEDAKQAREEAERLREQRDASDNAVTILTRKLRQAMERIPAKLLETLLRMWDGEDN